ncbi:lymphocyte antigen 75-like [Siniperca chuatsi]|uniref:lymphocyte antigen 75-like n=1 Tax=Siniperca chuatsi TaxID=119488 RepID=UPI001CE182D3|nr:lymphocyte antigen 75-like [Siniperca chuatsi]
MAEEEVNYASLVFKANKHSPPEAKKEETVYNEVKVQNKTTDQTADTNVSAGFLPDKKANSRRRCCQQVACGLGILCVILLLGIIAVCVYFTLSLKSEQYQTAENQNLTTQNQQLNTQNQNLTTRNQQLETQNQNLTTQNQQLTTQNQNLTTRNQQLETQNQNLTTQNQQLNTQNQNLTTRNQQLTTQNQNLTTQNQNLTTRNQQLTTQNQNLTTRNQQLETQRNNLTEQIRNMEIKWNELNVTRAQWSIDAYCPKGNGISGRQCVACQKGWEPSQSSCYAINDPQPDGQRTWEGAREDCRGKISDLVVIVNQMEKTFISAKSWGSSGTSGYWIGLRAEGGKWKWVDGRDLTENSWLQQPAINGQCAISVHNEGLKSVSCAEKNRWICKKKGLSTLQLETFLKALTQDCSRILQDLYRMTRKQLEATGTFNYSNVQVSAENIQEEAASFNSTADRMTASSDKKSPSVIQFFPRIAVCWVILSLIMALRIYFTTIITENNSKLTAEIQQLKTQKNSLEKKIENIMDTPRKACQKGWQHFQSSCYTINNVDGPNQSTWEDAQNNCRGRNAHLVVIGSPEEQEFIYNSSWSSWGNSGYWIGLRVEAGSWKWVDGSNLTADYWTVQPSDNAHCAISVEEKSPKGWTAVDCNTINRWICEKKDLSV